MENNFENARKFIKTKMPRHLHGGEARQLEIARCMIDYTNQALRIHDVVGQSEQLPCDVCGSTDVIEAPHMGRNCNRCHPL